jgi:predicted NBD/HSP70 family sugar kinase
MSRMKIDEGQGASNRTPRRINSNLVLNTVRRRQPISRVELARVSGLQPSTVSLIVEELLRSDWLFEGETVKGARGRRPRLLTMSEQKCVIAVDIHPRQTTLALTEISGRIAWQNVLSLPQDPRQAVNRLSTAIQAAIQAHPGRAIEGIGICLPGRTDPNAKDLIFAPNLRWPIVSLKAKIERASGLRVWMDNVANACALSEVWFSESARMQDLVVVEVSEGLGTGIFVNGAIARGKDGMAGEFGHIQMVEDGPQCNCGSRGCWETLASNNAAVRYYSESTGGHKHVTFSNLLRMATAQHDPMACAALQRMAENLGRGMRMVAAALAPAEIVVVGEITAAWHIIGNLVEAEMRKHPLAGTVRLRPAYDGASARLRSAVALVFAETFTQS